MRCAVCRKDGAKEKFPFEQSTITLCWDCTHKVRKSIMGFLDGVETLISEDVVIKSIAMQFYQEHRNKMNFNNGDE